MLQQSLTLSLLAFLIGVLPLFALSGDPLLAARWSSIPAALALAFGAWAQVRVIRANVTREIQRANWHPYHAPALDAAPVLPAETQPNTAEIAPPRSFVYNAGGKSSTITLLPADDRLIRFLDTAIRLSAADKPRFPTVEDFKRSGVKYPEYSEMMAWLGEAVERKTATIRGGYTLGDLRRMASGG